MRLIITTGKLRCNAEARLRFHSQALASGLFDDHINDVMKLDTYFEKNLRRFVRLLRRSVYGQSECLAEGSG